MVDVADSESDILHMQVDKVGRKLLATINVQADSCAYNNTAAISARHCSHMNVMRVMDYQTRGRPKMQPSTSKLTMYDGSQVLSKGQCYLQMRESGQEQTLMFEVV